MGRKNRTQELNRFLEEIRNLFPQIAIGQISPKRPSFRDITKDELLSNEQLAKIRGWRKNIRLNISQNLKDVLWLISKIESLRTELKELSEVELEIFEALKTQRVKRLVKPLLVPSFSITF